MSESLLSKTPRNIAERVMGALTAVAECEGRLKWMVSKEMRGPGDGGSALERIIARHKLSAAAVKSILYRKPSDMYVSVYLSINAAYLAELSRWERAFEHERAVAKAKTKFGEALLRLAHQADGQENGSVSHGQS